ncbi:putative leucine-rich repeat-containing protein DDB_G0290503 isoform X3 [Parasteatoda tepidariorum]|uniref:putative leucine-rich repeat-containing protein DDB_G0290503 isoform X3 n=1 Tax=Parasteatoda tepidariorum TaxID=114398 RepID=UPI001C72911E|nr:putative leucine-rich repeat-containing protein DDB_G0290503 isoform X2 [Parasteatoda tepidariorum]XP_042895865.1 putative leucine-rich repeat-containing protein DDB_G0290503 isoform X2 [Parasteatoda tepidariorum]
MHRNETKQKKVHWIPPGRTSKDYVPSKENKSKNSSAAIERLYSKGDSKEIESVSLNASSDESKDDSSIYLNDIKQQHRVLNLYYMSLRPVLQKHKRLIGNLNIQDDTIQELVSKVETELNNLFGSLEDLEFSISLFENALSESSHSGSLTQIIKTKDNLLKKLFDCYHDILHSFLVALEELNSRDTKELEKERDDFLKQYQAQEKKYRSQAAVVKDLERQLSILQGKYRAVEGYNTTLEDTKAEFQKMIHHKDVQIKNLTSELTKLSLKGDDTKWIELLEEIEIKHETEKQALKKAMKAQKLAQKLYNEDRKHQLKALEEEKEKKGKMLVNLADERDKLRVQMAMINNELVCARNSIEEIKSQNLKLQNKLSECEIDFRNQLQRESEVLKKQLQEKEDNELKLKNTIKHLEEELSSTIKESEILKSRHDSIKASLLQAQNENSVDKVFDEVRSLTSLLQDTKEQFQNFKTPAAFSAGDNSKNEKNPDIENVVAMLQDMRREMLEIKRHDVPRNQQDKSNESELLTKLEELRQELKATSEENLALKKQLKEMENSSTFSQYALDENYSTNDLESKFLTRDLKLQLALKSEEIQKYKQQKKNLESQLEEIKDKLHKKEMETIRLYSLEDELRSKKLELSLLEQRKQEESEKLLKRTKDLQEALDESTTKNELLSRHIDMLKVSLYNVFGES